MNKMKRQPTEREKLFANKATNKGLVFKIYEQLMQLYVKKKKKKWAERINRHLSREDIQMARKPMKRYQASLIIGEIQIRTTMRYHFVPVRMATIKVYKQ